MQCSNCSTESSRIRVGLCGKCYARLRRHGSTAERPRGNKDPCWFCGELETVAKGLCKVCYERQKRNGTPDYVKIRGTCSKEGCDRPHAAKGLCDYHYRLTRERKRHPLEYLWFGMLRRCRNPKHHKYPRYGGRGITVCEHWNTFQNFVQDMGERPSKSHSLDRINNDGNYEPGNVRWATPKEQRNNQ